MELPNSTPTQEEELVWRKLLSMAVIATIVSEYVFPASNPERFTSMASAAISRPTGLGTGKPFQRPVILVHKAAQVVLVYWNALDVVLSGLYRVRYVFAILLGL